MQCMSPATLPGDFHGAEKFTPSWRESFLSRDYPSVPLVRHISMLTAICPHTWMHLLPPSLGGFNVLKL